jgi:hypothetical protein
MSFFVDFWILGTVLYVIFESFLDQICDIKLILIFRQFIENTLHFVKNLNCVLRNSAQFCHI